MCEMKEIVPLVLVVIPMGIVMIGLSVIVVKSMWKVIK
jgi:hypothetical protein